MGDDLDAIRQQVSEGPVTSGIYSASIQNNKNFKKYCWKPDSKLGAMTGVNMESQKYLIIYNHIW